MWLSVLPIENQGFNLNKDALNIHYNRPIKDLPSKCPCGEPFNVQHAIDCKRGGFISIWHNEVRDLEGSLLSEVCKDVRIELILQPPSGETYQQRSTNIDENAKLDVKARGFWKRGKTALLIFVLRMLMPPHLEAS